MSEFEEMFKSMSDILNQRLKSDAELQDAIKKYAGRRLTLVIDGDATHEFAISSDGVRYTINPPERSNDMSLKMGLDQARRIIVNRAFAIPDLLSIERRNIGMADVGFAMKLFMTRKK